MSSDPKTCEKCGEEAYGRLCRSCDRERRQKAHADSVRARRRKKRGQNPPALALKERYPVPVPSPDSRPLTKEEREEAICPQVDTEIFFAELGENYHAAKQVCFGCPIKARCLAVALANNEEFGVFGGASPPERKRIRREMEKAARPRELESPSLLDELATRKRLLPAPVREEGVA